MAFHPAFCDTQTFSISVHLSSREALARRRADCKATSATVSKQSSLDRKFPIQPSAARMSLLPVFPERIPSISGCSCRGPELQRHHRRRPHLQSRPPVLNESEGTLQSRHRPHLSTPTDVISSQLAPPLLPCPATSSQRQGLACTSHPQPSLDRFLSHRSACRFTVPRPSPSHILILVSLPDHLMASRELRFRFGYRSSLP